MADETNAGSATLETPKDAGQGNPGLVSRWLKELDLAERAERNWRERAKEAIDRYRDEKDRTGVRFNILFSNVQTLAPALYNSTPKPDVRRRFRDPDPLGKIVADILERCITTSLDRGDFDGVMQYAIMDYLLPGRAVTRVRYIPSFQTVTPEVPAELNDVKPDDLPDEFKPFDALADEEVVAEPVDWEDFRHGPGRKWSQVRWVAFRHRLTREEAVEKFGAETAKLDLDFTPDDPSKDSASGSSDDAHMFTPPDVFKRLTVWEIWSKDDREVIFIALSKRDAPLAVEPDPLKLEGFFPIPRPLYAVESADSLVPIEEFRIYKDQAKELDKITQRINRLINGLKLRGVYDSTLQEIGQLFKADDNDMVPAENVAQYIVQGGMDKAIWMLPIDKAAAVLVSLYEQRQALVQGIYELTGISDIQRGASRASETATAQNIKAQFGSMRLQRRQREVQRYARDLIRLMAEIIGEHFSVDTIRRMSGIQMPTAEEKAQQISGLQAQMAQIQQQQAMAAQQAAMQGPQQPSPQMAAA